MPKEKKHIIALYLDEELHAQIATAAKERRLPITAWCTQHLIDALTDKFILPLSQNNS